MREFIDVLDKIDTLNKHDKVFIVYGKNADQYTGFVESVTDEHLVIHEYVPDIYRTMLRENIVEIAKIV